MKHKILLVGKNKAIMDDFFYTMSAAMRCQTSSDREEDMVCHQEFFCPDAVVYCMGEETRNNMEKIINGVKKMGRTVPLFVAGEREKCEEVIKIAGDIVKLAFVKPVSSTEIQKKVAEFFKDDEQKEEVAYQEILPEQEIREIQSQVSKGPARILVIDDDVRMLRLLKDELHGHFEVATAPGGKVARKYLSMKTVDLILLDYDMPEESGPEILVKLRENPKTREIPVIFLTGVNDKAKIETVVSLKPQGYLLKPIEHDKLNAMIERVLGQ